MSLDSSYEHSNREPPRSAASAEANYNLVVQRDNEGMPFPAMSTMDADQEGAIHQPLQNPAALNDAGMAALHQYWASRQAADLDRAIECWREALNLTPPDSPDRPEWLSNLGCGLYSRYEHTGKLADPSSPPSSRRSRLPHPTRPTCRGI